MAGFKCSICGGDLVNDYMSGACRCGHCGNHWALEDLDPSYKNYLHIIEKLNKANGLLASPDTGVKQAEEALLLYKGAAAECTRGSSEMLAELRELCADGQKKAGECKAYAAAKSHFDKKAYAKALDELEKLPPMYKERDEIIKQCRAEIEKARRRRLPYAVVVGMILPAILFFFLKEKADISMALCALIFVAASAVCIYAVYRNGGISMLIEILSFVLLVPLLLFTVFAYVLHLGTGLAAGLAIGIPAAVIIIIAIFAERQ